MKYVNARSFLNKRLNILEIKRKRSHLLSRPVYVSVEPTVKCNSFCVMCNRNATRKGEDKDTGFLSWQVLKALRPFFRWAEMVCFGGFGEPLLHPDFLRMLSFIKTSGPEVYFFTNGILLNPDTSRRLIEMNADKVCVSFGGAKPETYEFVRGVKMEPILENLEALRVLKKQTGSAKPFLSFNIVAMNSVLRELNEIIALAASLGVQEIAMPHLCVQGPDVASESPWNDLDGTKRILAEAAEQARAYDIRFLPPDFTSKKTPCHALSQAFSVTWDGLVLSCPLERFILGDLVKDPPESVWNSPQLVHLRRRVYSEGLSSTCPNCFCWDSRAETYLKPNLNSRHFAIDLRKR